MVCMSLYNREGKALFPAACLPFHQPRQPLLSALTQTVKNQNKIQLKQFSKLQHTNKHINHPLLSNHRASSQKQHSESLIRGLMSCGKITLFILSYLFSVLSEIITRATTEPHKLMGKGTSSLQHTSSQTVFAGL